MDRKGLEVSVIGWLILGLVSLFVIIGIIMLINGKASPILDNMLAIFRYS